LLHPFTIIALRGITLGVAAAAAVWLATLPLPLAEGARIAGPAEVSDGDTLVVGGLRVRLFGADAPESAQLCGTAGGGEWDCGAAATDRLRDLVEGETVTCAITERDLYGRVVAACAAGGRDLGAAMVGEGLAWAYRAYSDAYVGAEDEARAAGRGVWQGEALVAWDWRRGGWQAASGAVEAAPAEPPEPAKADPPAPVAVAGDCRIKGNTNAAGERIYHTPASPWYARVQIDAARGQRWFCTEAEAEAAGWREAGGSR
jgi:endonuclease YncB( thermonuclease family)